jgi:hypothetical protein
MATGAVTAREPKVDAKGDTLETPEPQPVTLRQRIKRLLHEIFAGHEDHLGWRQ